MNRIENESGIFVSQPGVGSENVVEVLNYWRGESDLFEETDWGWRGRCRFSDEEVVWGMVWVQKRDEGRKLS